MILPWTMAVLLTLAGLVCGCGGSDSEPILANVDRDLQVTMDWSGCPGAPFDCPNYSVTVDASGLVIFNGESGVEQQGVATRRINAMALEELVEELERADFFQLPCCRCDTEFLIADSPLSRIAVLSDGVRTEALHNHACWQSPDHPRLSGLEIAIERILSLCPWIGSVSFHQRCGN